jgi:hypothetical protein
MSSSFSLSVGGGAITVPVARVPEFGGFAPCIVSGMLEVRLNA